MTLPLLKCPPLLYVGNVVTVAKDLHKPRAQNPPYILKGDKCNGIITHGTKQLKGTLVENRPIYNRPLHNQRFSDELLRAIYEVSDLGTVRSNMQLNS